MGLFFQFPVRETEAPMDRVWTPEQRKHGLFEVRSYGPPMIFWGYLAVSLVSLLVMYFAIAASLNKMALYGESFDLALVYTVRGLFVGLPILALAAFFYEKRILKKGNKIIIQHRVFGVRFIWSTYSIQDLYIKHYLDSPNMAKKLGRKDMRAFHNQGYFELFLKTLENKDVRLDRSSQKANLKLLQEMLQRY